MVRHITVTSVPPPRMTVSASWWSWCLTYVAVRPHKEGCTDAGQHRRTQLHRWYQQHRAIAHCPLSGALTQHQRLASTRWRSGVGTAPTGTAAWQQAAGRTDGRRAENGDDDGGDAGADCAAGWASVQAAAGASKPLWLRPRLISRLSRLPIHPSSEPIRQPASRGVTRLLSSRLPPAGSDKPPSLRAF